ncbi:acyl-CoA dehydrogenase family protein [Caballeronia sp. S22]|uniref:acyl-CoA dehydrogenase family protein n=1 Tax=Caballeronia sp. S22 TaxID=3137182 RepID=UPI003530CA6F
MTYPYLLPVRDMMFVIEDWLDALSTWRAVPEWADLDMATVEQILSEAGRFVAGRIAPLNAIGDAEGCRFDNGDVFMPTGFVSSYRAYVEAGWPLLAADEELGGQNLPGLLEVALHEMLAGANHAWLMSPGLSHGAVACLKAHASEEIKQAYLAKIASGEWLTTMCLTEPQAGTDLGRIRTKALIDEDGNYRLTGEKIFITGGEHDLTENIVHLVLARLPDALPGSRGLSLFLVPKYLPSANGMQRNSVTCDGIEKKMGLKASPTCTMHFDNATGYLIGQAHGGLRAMFVMMNAARLQVAMQGVGHAESARQRASAYAEERVQTRTPSHAGDDAPTPISHHPAIRRVLLDLRCTSEGERMIGYWVGEWIDKAARHPNRAERKQADAMASLLTPIAKAFFTANGFNSASNALQVFGGYGYMQEYGVEQTVRDSRVSMLYEGTNEVQAVDLVLRKVLSDRGETLRSLLSIINEESAALAKTGENGAQISVVLSTLCFEMNEITSAVIERSEDDKELPYRVADAYLSAAGWLLLSFAWARTWRICVSRSGTDPFHADKISCSQYFFDFKVQEFFHCRRQVQACMDSRIPVLRSGRA